MYIQGNITLREPSPSLVKASKKTTKVPSRPAKKKTTKMSDSDSSNASEDEDTRGTPGAEHAYGVLSFEQNKIWRELMQVKLVRKG